MHLPHQQQFKRLVSTTGIVVICVRVLIDIQFLVVLLLLLSPYPHPCP